MIRDLHRVLDLVESGFQRYRVLVVGDLMLDQYLWGDVSRISPEAPVPVLRSARRTHVAGGAANVAMNLVGLGAQVSLAGFLGSDESAETLRWLLTAAGIATDAVCVWKRPTISKTRIMAGRQQLMRLDVETARVAVRDGDRFPAAIVNAANCERRTASSFLITRKVRYPSRSVST